MASSVTYQIWIDDQGDTTLLPRSNAPDFRYRECVDVYFMDTMRFDVQMFRESISPLPSHHVLPASVLTTSQPAVSEYKLRIDQFHAITTRWR